MLYGLYQSAAGMMTSEYRQDVVANNLANASTPGFKQDIASLMERPLESEVSGRPGIFHPLWSEMTGGTFAAPTMTNFGNGRLEQTEQDLDLALQGDGFFTVKDGEVHPVTRVRTRTAGIDYLYNFVAGFPHIDELAVEHATTPDEADALVERLGSLFPKERIYKSTVSPVIGTYVGPHVLSVSVLEAETDK